MPNIIVCTNFSETSRNALTYACSLINQQEHEEDFSILLLNVYTIPVSYSGDGIALITINNALDDAEADLHEELDWAHEAFPTLNIIGKVTTGRLLRGIKDEIDGFNASLVIIGAGGHYGELWSWDSNILNALRDLPIPVLTIPPNVSFTPLQEIAFACNLKNVNENTPFDRLKTIIQLTKATLHVVYVTSQEIQHGTKEAENQEIVHSKLKELSPVYDTLLETQVVNAIVRFVEEKNIKLLLVIPTRHGLWESLFYKSYTNQLARLNRIPIMALH